MLCASAINDPTVKCCEMFTFPCPT